MYNLIYADPPWSYRDRAGRRGAAAHYSTMTVGEIAALPIAQLAAPDCLLAMWWVAPMPLEALLVIEAWGFRLKTMKGFTWHKTTRHGHSHFGMGHWTRANTEDCLFATRGKPLRRDAGISQFVSAPRLEPHSSKPKEIRDLLVRLVGDVPRLELFARERTEGWKAWGQEVGCDSF